MEINLWIEQGRKQRVRGARGKGKDATALRAAIREARGDRADEQVLWCQERLNPLVRNLARLVLGLGSTVGVFLLVALAVVGSDTRSALLVALTLLAVVGGGFVGIVWSLDVGITVHADGRLVRAGWGGVREFDLRDYRRVTVKELPANDASAGHEIVGD